MRLSRIETEGCAALARLQVAGLSPGLNVILGPNGSGKTSLLRFVRDLLQSGGRSVHRTSQTLPAAGLVEMESRSGPLRIRRIPRPGHPDTVAVIAATASAADRATADDCSAALLRFVEPVNLHQTAALATLAGDVTDRLSARELGSNWTHLRTAASMSDDGSESLMAVLSRLAVIADQDVSGDALLSGDLSANDANWRTVISALSRQREQLSLECEAHLRMQNRRQREWETRLRWLNERAAEQKQDVHRLDEEWQAAESDRLERDLTRSAAPPLVQHDTQPFIPAGTRSPDESLELLRQVLEDLAAERMQLLLATTRGPALGLDFLETERRRIDGCEREIVEQMRRLLLRHNTTSNACVCPTCGASVEPANVSETPLDSSVALHCAELQRELFAARDQWAATQRSIYRLEDWRARRGDDSTIDQLRYQISELDAQVIELESLRRVDLSSSMITLRHQSGRRHNVLRDAGRRLASLTGGRYAALRWNPESAELFAEGNDGEFTAVAALSRGTHEQVAMALRLAVLHALTELGGSQPVIWDEPLADSDEQRLDVAAQQLAEFAKNDSQLLLLTCREHVARALANYGATVHRIGAEAAGEPDVLSVLETHEVASTVEPPKVPVRVHPGSAFWLHLDSPLEQLPSLSPQSVRSLSSLGIADVRDLVGFDATGETARLVQSQVDPAQLQIWQAEARLLTQVAELTGRDAQLLVSCGILSREELAAAETDELTRRIDRMRGGDTLRWRLGPSTAPHRETIERWVESARRQPPADPSHRRDEAARLRRNSDRSTGPRSLPSRATAPANPPAVALRFRLQPESPIVDAPSIGHKTARRLQRIGIATVRDLLVCDPQPTATRLRHRRLTAETVCTWQRQAGLMCSVPDLRCADAIVLVACGITGPLDLRRISAAALHATLEPLVASSAGQRLLRGAIPPTFADIQRWIETVEESRIRRAA